MYKKPLIVLVILDDISFAAKRTCECFKTHHINTDEQLSVLPLSCICHNTKTRSRLSVGCNQQNYSIIWHVPKFPLIMSLLCVNIQTLNWRRILQKSFVLHYFYSMPLPRAATEWTWYVPEFCREFRRSWHHVTDTLTWARWAGGWSALGLDVSSRSSVYGWLTVMTMMMMMMRPVYRASCRTLTPTRLNIHSTVLTAGL